MGDALVRQGGVALLPWSFRGVALRRGPSGLSVVVNRSTKADSDQLYIDTDAAMLAYEVRSIHAAWPSTRIAIVAHSLGGLIAEQYWEYYWRANADGVTRILTLDSPINGETLAEGCFFLSSICLKPPFSAANDGLFKDLWLSLGWHDPQISAHDTGNVLLTVGTEGDQVHKAGDIDNNSVISQVLVSCSGFILFSCNLRRRASITFSRASERVRPWLIAPGTSSTWAMIQPSPPSG